MNPYELDQRQLYDFGVHFAKGFLDANDVDYPNFTAKRLVPEGRAHGSYGCGHYVPHRDGPGTVLVDPNECAKPAMGTARRYSFPGYKVDRTPVGVVAHEVGHYLDHVFGYPSRTRGWQAAMRGDKVSSYEPNESEAFAESVRLLGTNFFLLKFVAPKRFDFLTELGIEPAENMPRDPIARLVEMHAAPGIVEAATTLVQRRTK